MLQAEGAAQMRDGAAVSELVRGHSAPVGLVTGLPRGAGRAWVRSSVDAFWERWEGGRPAGVVAGRPPNVKCAFSWRFGWVVSVLCKLSYSWSHAQETEYTNVVERIGIPTRGRGSRIPKSSK